MGLVFWREYGSQSEARLKQTLILGLWGLAGLLPILSTTAARAAGGGGGGGGEDTVVTSEALSDTNDEVHVVSHSTAEFLPQHLSISDFALIGGPQLNNPEGNYTPPSLPKHGGLPPNFMPSPGYSLQDLIEIGYSINDNIKMGPVFGVNDSFYQGTGVSLTDPAMRFTVRHISYQDFVGVNFDSDLWTSYTAPVSNMTRSTGSIGTLGLNYIPRLLIKGSRFFFSGVAGLDVTGADGSTDPGLLTNERIIGALQANYRLHRRWTMYLTNSYSASIGPTLPITDPSLLSDPAMAQLFGGSRFNHPVSMRTGAYFRATSDITISPTLNWFTDEPVNTTTMGLSASFTLL